MTLNSEPPLIPSAKTLDSFIILKKLGSGAYSSVYHVTRRETMKDYALKKVNLTPLTEKERRNAINEIRILASLKSRFVTKYKEVFIDKKVQLPLHRYGVRE